MTDQPTPHPEPDQHVRQLDLDKPIVVRVHQGGTYETLPDRSFDLIIGGDDLITMADLPPAPRWAGDVEATDTGIRFDLTDGSMYEIDLTRMLNTLGRAHFGGDIMAETTGDGEFHLIAKPFTDIEPG